jgi:hypothetical protein
MFNDRRRGFVVVTRQIPLSAVNVKTRIQRHVCLDRATADCILAQCLRMGLALPYDSCKTGICMFRMPNVDGYATTQDASFYTAKMIKF